MSSLRSILLLCIVTLSMTVLAAPVAQVGGLVPDLTTGSGSDSGSSSGSGHSGAGAGTKDNEDGLDEVINNGYLNGNKIITSVNTLNDVLNDNLNDSNVLSNDPIASGNNIANIGGGNIATA